MTTHGHPPTGSVLTPCCYAEPRTLPIKDRLTRDATRVTCNR